MAKVVPNFSTFGSPIQRTGSEPSAVHRAEHLDVAHGIEAEAAGDAFLDELDEPRDGNVRPGCLNEIKIRCIPGSRQIGHLPRIDPVVALNNLT